MEHPGREAVLCGLKLQDPVGTRRSVRMHFPHLAGVFRIGKSLRVTP